MSTPNLPFRNPVSRRLLTAGSLIGFTLSAHAAVTVTDNFDDGVFPGTNWGGNTAAYSEASPNGPLNTVTRGGFGSHIGNSTAFNITTDPIIHVQADFLVNSNQGGNTSSGLNDFIGLAILNSTDTTGYAVRYNRNTTTNNANLGESSNFDAAFNAVASNPSGPGVNGNTGGLVTNHIYRVTLDYNATTGALNSSLINLTTSTTILSLAGNDTTPIGTMSHFGIYTGGAETNDISILNFSASAVPEPSSTALLGLAGLTLILRRRR
ncbi:hypothetical protein NT6N_15950 [Oceaniferula spumae]|uniref:Ice-binding protein C-terminal domain-containing protein n=1 Tax=Oceaniferula spumae TaxID=2979115 RepID=A0AAT9FKR3_9BACT